jgi:hypothetical protein
MPGSRAAERIVAILLKEDAPTCEQMAQKLGASLSAFCLYLKGRRKIPLWLAVAVEKQRKIPVEEWLEKPRRAAT